MEISFSFLISLGTSEKLFTVVSIKLSKKWVFVFTKTRLKKKRNWILWFMNYNWFKGQVPFEIVEKSKKFLLLYVKIQSFRSNLKPTSWKNSHWAKLRKNNLSCYHKTDGRI